MAASAERLPAVFISHGSRMLVFEDIPARTFIAGLGNMLGRPRAILCVSAHWEAEQPTVSAAVRPETIHDFYGFPGELYRLRYPAPGAPDLARRAAALIEASGGRCAPCRSPAPAPSAPNPPPPTSP